MTDTDLDIDEDVDDGPSPEELAPGVARALSPLVRRMVAPNPGIMTGPGTNSYLVGIDEIAVIDPGPADDDHLDAIVGCGGDRIRWIVLTHPHLDHAPGAAGLAERTGAEVLAFGPATTEETAALPVTRPMAAGDRIDATEFRLEAIHTPGHHPDHICLMLLEERVIFTGDHVNNGQTVVINPPDGDMALYLASLERLTTFKGMRRLKSLAPGHGHLITDPYPHLRALIEHRLERERQVRAAVSESGGATVDEIVLAVYADSIIEELVPVAARTTLAHLYKLRDDGQVTGDDETSTWTPA